MAFLTLKSPLSAAERMHRRRLIVSDTLSLATLFVITVLLAVLTNYLYQSYASHQAELAKRWLARGESALHSGRPLAAINALRSALAYSPGEPKVEIELAEALASAGRIQEATSYFTSLLESEPGNGLINLQLARLAARQGDVEQALEDYHRAIYGNWEGDGYVRRRQVRMELIDFLISRKLLDQARSELLVASGNAPEGDTGIQLEIAQKMELAQDPTDALHLYRSILKRQPESFEAMEGAGRTAFELGRYLQAKAYLERAAELGSRKQNPELLRNVHNLLHEANRLLLLYPSSQLNLRARSTRILIDRQIAQARFNTCAAAVSKVASPPAGQAPTPSNSPGNALANLASRFAHLPTQKAGTVPAPTAAPIAPLAALASRWKQEPASITLSALEKDPDLAQSEVRLIYDTEKITQQVCGAPSGDDALLLKIAELPNAVEQE